MEFCVGCVYFAANPIHLKQRFIQNFSQGLEESAFLIPGKICILYRFEYEVLRLGRTSETVYGDGIGIIIKTIKKER
jgi:hypothetical protein